MIAVFIGFIRSHWLGTVAGLFLIGIAAKISLQQIEIAHLHNQIVLCTAQNATLEHSNQALVSALDKQNAAIAVWHQEGQRKIKSAAFALEQAKANSAHYAFAAQKIKIQPVTSDTCAGMRLLVDNYVRNTP